MNILYIPPSVEPENPVLIGSMEVAFYPHWILSFDDFGHDLPVYLWFTFVLDPISTIWLNSFSYIWHHI